MNIYALTFKQLKDYLVSNKYTTYQQQLEKTLQYPFYARSYHQLTVEEKEYCKNNKITICQQYCCYNAGIQYHKTVAPQNYTYDAYNHMRSTRLIKYDTFINAHYKSIDGIKVKETIWVNTTKPDIVNKINISGNFTMKANGLSPKLGELSYIPNVTYGLRLNNIPVAYISGCTGGNALQRQRYQHCLKLEFTFDLTTYCHMIDTVLKCRKYKHHLFGLLPFELLKYILYLTSIN